jgi:hypothetical protein
MLAALILASSVHIYGPAREAGEFIHVLPTLGVGMSTSLDSTGAYLGVPVWLGGAMHIKAGRTGAVVMSMGTEINVVGLGPRPTFVEIAPAMRLGGTFRRDRQPHWLDQMLPDFGFYGLIGIRARNRHRTTAARLGWGFTFGSLWRKQLDRDDQIRLLVPFSIEAVVDLGFDPTVVSLRAGYQF